jgi:chorismate dehydratase
VTRYPALAGLRIGCVKYLNSKPLIRDYPGPVVFDHPAKLAEGMIAGALDAALVPVFATFSARPWLLVDDVAIACRGPVYSVFLAYEGELAGLESVALDPASLTSVHLLKALLQEFHGLTPRYVSAGEPAAARLIIGNQAIDYRESAPAGTRYLDLGEEWQRQTGLPFVFALWLLRPDLPDASRVAANFRALKQAGLQRRSEIVEQEEGRNRDFVRRYLTEHIRFDLGPQEKAAVELFRRLSVKQGLATEPLAPLQYV